MNGALSVFIPAGEHAGSGTLTTAADDTSGVLEAVTDAGSTGLTLSRRPPASPLSLTGLSPRRYRQIQGFFMAGVMLALVSFASAAPIPTLPPDIKKCVWSPSLGTGLRTATIVAGLGLPGDVVRELRSRLGSYLSATGFEGLDGLGLTVGQIATIQRRLELQVMAAGAKPAGWPCVPFAHRSKVTAFARAKLIAEGFDPAITFGTSFPRQIHFHGIRGGVDTSGMLVVLGPRKLGMVWRVFGNSGSERWSVPFAP